MRTGIDIAIITSRSVEACQYADDEIDVVSFFKGNSNKDIELKNDFGLRPCDAGFNIAPLFEL